MKLTIVIPDEMKERLNRYIAKRFGNQQARAQSLVIREALNDFFSKQEKLEEAIAGEEARKLTK